LSDIMSSIISIAQAKIGKELQERKAFDENSAADAEEAKINFKAVLDIMERGGLICRTYEGKVFITKKGQEKQENDFSTDSSTTQRKIVRFSRNK
jgi:hypothetical protein